MSNHRNHFPTNWPLVVLDFETYFDSKAGYTLRKLPTSAYVRDPRFEALCVAIKVYQPYSSSKPIPLRQAKWSTSPDLTTVLPADALTPRYGRQAIASKLPKQYVLCGHNLPFDAFILNHHYGIRPPAMLDTLALFRYANGVASKGSLLDASAYFMQDRGVANTIAANAAWKSSDTYDNFDGINTAHPDFAAREARLAQLASDDVDKTRELLDSIIRQQADLYVHQPYSAKKRMVKRLGNAQLWAQDLITRMSTEPRLELDLPVLSARMDALTSERETLLDEAKVYGATCATDIVSNLRFAKLLCSHGVADADLPRTPKGGYAFAASNPAFTDLLGHANPYVARLVQLRLDIKSDTERKRCEAYIKAHPVERIAPLPPKQPRVASTNKAARPVWTTGLNYAGAVVTNRVSGNSHGGGNPQNLSRGSALRKAIVAPDGYAIVAGDSSQIELRLHLHESGQHKDLKDLHNGHDLYSQSYADTSGIPLADVTKEQRHIGKVTELQLQYQSGAETLLKALRAQGIQTVDLPTAQRMVHAYRAKRHHTVACWHTLDMREADALSTQLPGGAQIDRVWSEPRQSTRDLTLLYEGEPALYYPDVRISRTYETITSWDIQWMYTKQGTPQNLYGGKVWQNLIQHLAYKIMEAQMVVFWQHTGIRPALMVHDEVVLVVPTAQADKAAAILLQCLRTTPKFIYNYRALPLDGEVGVGKTYLEAK